MSSSVCQLELTSLPAEILKQPVHTSVAIDKRDFEDFSAEDELHIAITLKDFKAILTHAETTGVLITARYTRPCRPLQLAYDFEGVRTEFTLMTTGEDDSEDFPSSRAAVPELSARQTPAPVHVSQNNAASNREQMPPPRSRSIRPLTGTIDRVKETNVGSQQPLPQSIHFDSLFVPADDDRQWDVPNEEDETMAEDTLGWDATADQVRAPRSCCGGELLIVFFRRHSTQVLGLACETLNPFCRMTQTSKSVRKKWAFLQHNAFHRLVNVLVSNDELTISRFVVSAFLIRSLMSIVVNFKV